MNEGVSKATKAFEGHSNLHSSLFLDFMRNYFVVLGREFTKPVNHHYEYYISSLFSERILTNHKEINDANDFKFDCIIYPSVGNSYRTDNIAVKPSVLDNDFYLEKVIEFEIEEAFYDKPNILSYPESISLAKIKNSRTTSKILKDGKIIWD